MATPVRTVESRPAAPAPEPPAAMPPVISAVIPLFNEAGSLEELHRQLTGVLAQTGEPYELIFVNDGSTDESPAILQQLHALDSHVTVIHLRRKFGKAEALATGFSEARGTIILTLDADLQDDPTEIPRFLEQLGQGYDLVVGWKRRRRDRITRVIASRFFNLVNRLCFDLPLHDMNCGFKAIRREVIGELGLYGELHRYIPIYAHARGFRVTEIPVVHHPRLHGKSKYGLERYLRGFFDFLTSLLLTRFAKRPLHFFGGVGMVLAAIGLVICLVLTWQWVRGATALSERPLLILGVMLIILGVQTITTGLVGEMLIHREETRSVAGKFPIRSILRHPPE